MAAPSPACVGIGAEEQGLIAIARAGKTRRRTRIQEAKEEAILAAALDVFSTRGFRGATIDEIADAAGMSKPNLLYYFPTKGAIHRLLIDRLLETWLEPLRHIDASGEPLAEIRTYIRRKIEMARDFPRESRLFANEILQGAPHIGEEMRDLKQLVDEKAKIIRGWIEDGKLAPVDPHHLIFSIWATTQHYADFDAQVRAVLGKSRSARRFEEAETFLDRLYANALRASAQKK